MTRARVRDIDRGYRALMQDLRAVQAAPPRVYVGILQDVGAVKYDREVTQPDGSKKVVKDKITLAGYAAVNEFGSEDGHVPERSFLRSTVDEHTGRYAAALNRACTAFLDAAGDGPGAALSAMHHHLGLLGVRVTRDVRVKIRDLRDPPNAPATLEKKYPGDNPLIHTGRMRQSISFHVDMTGRGEGMTSTPMPRRRPGGAA